MSEELRAIADYHDEIARKARQDEAQWKGFGRKSPHSAAEYTRHERWAGILRSAVKESGANTVTLSTQEILDLAEFAGLVVRKPAACDDMEDEITICPCPRDGLINDDDTRTHYRLIAYYTDYPEEGNYGLGSALPGGPHG